MEAIVCPNCNKPDDVVLRMKIIDPNRHDLDYYPKFIPQIQARCGKCNTYIKFIKQSVDIIAEFNKLLDTWIHHIDYDPQLKDKWRCPRCLWLVDSAYEYHDVKDCPGKY